MANIIWNRFAATEQEEYIEFLKIFGALSGLFKDNQEGANAKKPYLYYRNHEQLFARVFSVEDLTRKDSAFDALAVFDDERIGIGLKTWIHSRDNSFQKVAEFNKLAPELITPLIADGDHLAVVRKVAQLRNERIMLDKRLHKTERNVYHYITRDDHVMNIVESAYDLIDIPSIELIGDVGKTYTFKDSKHKYKYYKSKSVLLEEFDASRAEIIQTFPIEQFDDPFELIRMIQLPEPQEHMEHEVIFLPLYQDSKPDGRIISECSGINARHGKSKNKGSQTLRPEYEVEVRVSKWIHHVFPDFFGFNALDAEHIKTNAFELVLPDGRVLDGRIKQQNGKSLQTNPQGALGEWIIKDVLGFSNREVVTLEYLDELGIDSLKITKEHDTRFKITVAEAGAYEKFKLVNEAEIVAKKLSRVYFRPELVQELVD